MNSNCVRIVKTIHMRTVLLMPLKSLQTFPSRFVCDGDLPNEYITDVRSYGAKQYNIDEESACSSAITVESYCCEKKAVPQAAESSASPPDNLAPLTGKRTQFKVLWFDLCSNEGVIIRCDTGEHLNVYHDPDRKARNMIRSFVANEKVASYNGHLSGVQNITRSNRRQVPGFPDVNVTSEYVRRTRQMQESSQWMSNFASTKPCPESALTKSFYSAPYFSVWNNRMIDET